MQPTEYHFCSIFSADSEYVHVNAKIERQNGVMRLLRQKHVNFGLFGVPKWTNPRQLQRTMYQFCSIFSADSGSVLVSAKIERQKGAMRL